eukprot:TRINITY_DN6360_c1_g1_i3.p1 TRINITY_DN6360_c1_g1~~TRINITY_DN6360_c1_g1_i3.p1  ORF type:complete len:359 (+),score=97.09 TRINITY_DN6360_c1_g1_i3:126-1202(+)
MVAGLYLRVRRRRLLPGLVVAGAAALLLAPCFVPAAPKALHQQRSPTELLVAAGLVGPALLSGSPAEAAEAAGSMFPMFEEEADFWPKFFKAVLNSDGAAADSSSQSPLFFAIPLLLVGAAAALVLSGDKSESVNDKEVVEKYFNGEGFERWQKIYGETDDVNPVQKDIRVGHAETVEKILTWLDPATISGKTVCDAGCGTGNLSIPLASRGAVVSGSDISAAMVGEASERAKAQLAESQVPKFATSDLEALSGKYDTVCCVDVLIHYPPEKMEGMVKHLAGMSNERFVVSFAPKTWYYLLLKRIGELFPGKSKTTRAYLHEEEMVEAALNRAGFKVTRREMTATNFYFSRLFEAKPA